MKTKHRIALTAAVVVFGLVTTWLMITWPGGGADYVVSAFLYTLVWGYTAWIALTHGRPPRT